MDDLKNIPTDRLIKELVDREPVLRNIISTAVLVLQRFCDDFCLHDDEIDAALGRLTSRNINNE